MNNSFQSNNERNSKDDGGAGMLEDSPFVSGRGFSLESILVDEKGSAIAEGTSAAPSHILEAEAERIIREAAQLAGDPVPELETELELPIPVQEPPQMQTPPQQTQQDEFFPEIAGAPLLSDTQDLSDIPLPSGMPEPPPPPISPRRETSESAADRLITEAYDGFDKGDAPVRYNEPDFNETGDIPMIVTPPEDAALGAGDNPFISSMSASKPMFAEDLPSVDVALDDGSTEGRKAARSSFFNQADAVDEPGSQSFEREDDFADEQFYEEPRLKDQAVKFARSCNSISQRLLPASIIALLMVLITIVFEAGMIVPFAIGTSLDRAASALILLLLIVMMLCVEVIIRGAEFLIHGKPNAETLVLFSCIFSLLSGTFTVVSGLAHMLPFCAVSALSLVIATFGERSNLRAMTDSLKVTISSAEPYGVQAEFNENLNNTVLKKSYSRTDGFYTNLTGEDITERLYGFAAPALLIGALFATVISVIFQGAVENSLHTLSALLAAAAPFSVLLSYPIPFAIVSKALTKSGVALAGWGGADEIAHTDGVCVTDDDLFPAGTLGLTAIKVFDGAAPNNVLCYTASLIIASGSGLTGLFAQVLSEKGVTPLRVANFECHESGISALIQGHQVATGSAAYMNLIGVRVPDDSNMRNAVFTAVNGRLVAMFTIDYKPLPGIQGALISMLKWRISLYFAMRDFNITPSMVGQKFKVPFESFVFMPVKESYSISDPYSSKPGLMSAVLVQESLKPYAEAITSARLLKAASFFATIVSIASAALGVLLMFLMLWGESFHSATPGNLMTYMFCMLIATVLICLYVKIRK